MRVILRSIFSHILTILNSISAKFHIYLLNLNIFFLQLGRIINRLSEFFIGKGNSGHTFKTFFTSGVRQNIWKSNVMITLFEYLIEILTDVTSYLLFIE